MADMNTAQVVLLHNGKPFNNGDMIQSGSVITVSATTETGTLHVEINKTEVELSGDTYSFPLEDNTYISVYVDDNKPAERYCLDYSTNDNTIITGTTTIGSGDTFNPGYYAHSGESVTVSAATIEGKNVVLYKNGKHVLWPDNDAKTYTFKLNEDTHIQTIYTDIPESGLTEVLYYVDVQVTGVTDPILTLDGNVKLPVDVIIREKIGSGRYTDVRKDGELYISYKGQKSETELSSLSGLTGNLFDVSEYLESGLTSNFKVLLRIEGDNGEIFESSKVVTVKFLTEIPYFTINNVVTGTLSAGTMALTNITSGITYEPNTENQVLSGDMLSISAQTIVPHYDVIVNVGGSQVTLDSGHTYTFMNDWDKTITTTFQRKSETMYNITYGLSGKTQDDVIIVESGIDGILTPNKVSQVSARDTLRIYANAYSNETIQRNVIVTLNGTAYSSNESDEEKAAVHDAIFGSGYTFIVTSATTIDVQFDGDNISYPLTSALDESEYSLTSASTVYTNIQIPDFSSLSTMNNNDNTLYAASNTRVLEDGLDGTKKAYDGGVYLINLSKEEGADDFIVKNWTIPAISKNNSGNKSFEDTEALTFDSENNMYLGFERLQQLVEAKWLLSGETPIETYDVIDTFDFTGRGHNPSASQDVDGYDANDGIEGIEFLSGHTFFVSNQINPTEVVLYDAFNKKTLNSQILPDPVSGSEIWASTSADYADLYWEIADLEYVKCLNELWVMNSERAVIYRYAVNTSVAKGTNFLTYINDIKLPMTDTDTKTTAEDGVVTYTIDWSNNNSIQRNNPEALTVDEHNGIIYVGAEGISDGNVPGKLYIFQLDTLKKKV